MSRTLFSTEAILAPPTHLAFNCEMVGRDIKGMSLKGFSRRLPDQLLIYKTRLKNVRRTCKEFLKARALCSKRLT